MSGEDKNKTALIPANPTVITRTGAASFISRGLHDLDEAESAEHRRSEATAVSPRREELLSKSGILHLPLNILLADDSVPAQNAGKKILMDAGYRVVTVSNGLEALRKIAEAIPDLAILDISMPDHKTGLEICERLRTSAATATLPLILTVPWREPYRPQDGEQVHWNKVILKPFVAAELISSVRSLIGAPIAQQNPPHR